MNRRTLNAVAASAAVLGVLGTTRAYAQAARAGEPGKAQIGMLIHPDMILLDMIGPMTVFAQMADMHLVARSPAPVMTDLGIPLMPTASFESCPRDLDVLFVPGGLKGTIAVMEDRATLDFLADRGARARYVTSVCTGALALGAAGLLRGYRATSHWYVRDFLPLLGAQTVADRVVVDRNRMTAGGVTSGIDFGLTLCALMRGEDYARRVQLLLEYAPAPPFNAGTPEAAGETLVNEVLSRRSPLIAAAADAARRAAAQFR